MSFTAVLEKYRAIAFSEKDKGERFERLMQAYLQTDPQYAYRFKNVWMWNEFSGKDELGGKDTGIDLVALTQQGEYWAIQCKCYQEDAIIDKSAVDSFLSTSSRKFKNDKKEDVRFSHRLWISTTNKWGPNATDAIRNQDPPVTRLGLHDLQEAPVDWDKLEKGVHGEVARITGRSLRPHQQQALDSVVSHFKKEERARLIMACGTGKTFTALRIAERQTKDKGTVLFLVPSIALLAQTLREWTAYAEEPINAICICSDPEVSKKKSKNEDSDGFSVVDLALPASTNVKSIVNQFRQLKEKKAKGMTVVFSTYQSIDVISKAQKELAKALPELESFDLIICDEAHRTTGVTLADEDESAFTKVHDSKFLKSEHRIYMTATPRLYSDDSKSKAAQADAVLCSMDDEKLFGQEVYRIGFGEAVEKNLLTDYKVLILTLSDKDVPPAIQNMISGKETEINTDDVTKLIGCVNGLSKQILGDEGIIAATDPEPMRRAVAFCQSIKVSNKITNTFNSASETYIESLPDEQKERMVSISSRHIDGTMAAPQRDELLSWLKAGGADGECRILTNVRCLSEGVDVPSLDAVLFLSARNSQVDVVQSVGRVMRRSPGKNCGYIIIPVVVPSDVDASKALDDNERYKVVWTVLNALRAHDDRFNATINKLELNKKRPPQIIVGGSPTKFDDDGNPVVNDPPEQYGKGSDMARQLAMQFEELQSVVFARMVQKVGDRRYWEQWAKNVAEIAERQVERINRLIRDRGKHAAAFDEFLKGLRKNINPSITEQEAVDMLSQHIITKPVFDALFEGYSFVKNNAVSVSMQQMLDLLEEQAIEKDTDTLKNFYESVRMRASGIDNAEGKQRIIVELYDKFFKTAFPKMVEKLGIVYTPIEVVDFIIHSVNDILKKEFGRSISDENVHVLDPFTGTGTFITRLLQSGLIELKDLDRKYLHELHANEIVLLAYYIAAVNIENAYHDATPDPDDGIGTDKYTPFEGIVLTDTFQLGETSDGEKLFSDMFPKNSARVERQKKAPVRVIIGNPPYSVGQKSANDNAQNQPYPKLDNRISETYAAKSSTDKARALYDAYLKAFRWSTDRLDEQGGVICFVTNGTWLDGTTASGFRLSIEKEFNSIYVFNLRGNQRTSGEISRKEGGKIFGSGSRTPITITLLVKKSAPIDGVATIYYKDIGDYLDRENKLKIIKDFGTFANPKMELERLTPNDYGDWVNIRSSTFEELINISGKSKSEKGFFETNSNGVITNRDNWVYASSSKELKGQLNSLIKSYNKVATDFNIELQNNKKTEVKKFISEQLQNVKWDAKLIDHVSKGTIHKLIDNDIRTGIYRPFFKQKHYFNKDFNWSRCLHKEYLPTPNLINPMIIVSGVGAAKPFSSIVVNEIPNRHLLDTCQCFPLYYYEENSSTQKSLFDSDDSQRYTCHDAISDFILEKVQKHYGTASTGAGAISKEDIFYYVYGFLHSPEYRTTFANDLKKMLPRLPLVEDVRDFWAFSKAGRKLAELHLKYEEVAPYPGVKVESSAGSTSKEKELYKVEKMRFPKKDQKDTIIYNSRITVSNIPAKAYEYVVNGKSAIEWIMERYQITTHKESGITNDPNDWSEEVGNPRYILDLLLSIINVSMQTVEIVEGLPKVKFE